MFIFLSKNFNGCKLIHYITRNLIDRGNVEVKQYGKLNRPLSLQLQTFSHLSYAIQQRLMTLDLKKAQSGCQENIEIMIIKEYKYFPDRLFEAQEVKIIIQIIKGLWSRYFLSCTFHNIRMSDR